MNSANHDKACEHKTQRVTSEDSVFVMFDYDRANKTVKLCLQIFTLVYIHTDQTPIPSLSQSVTLDRPKRDIINEWP